jgi:ankyrin repeat protein
MTNLFTAVHDGDLHAVKQLLATMEYQNINSIDWHQQTPLFIAARYGHTEIVKLLIEHNANIDMYARIPELTQNKSTLESYWQHQTPIFIAALNGHVAIVELLLAAGANIYDYMNPYIISIKDKKATQTTLAALSPSQVTSNKYLDAYAHLSPMHAAASRGHFKIVSLLQQKSSYGNLTHLYQVTAIQACKKDDLATIQEMLEQDVIVPQDPAFPQQQCFMHIAAIHGATSVIKHLLQNKHIFGLDLYQQDKHGRTMLMLAAGNGHTKIVREILDHTDRLNNVNLKDRRNYGATALHAAAQNGHAAAFKVLATAGDINIKDNKARTPTFIAAQAGRADILSICCAQGASGLTRENWQKAFNYNLKITHSPLVMFMLQKLNKLFSDNQQMQHNIKSQIKMNPKIFKDFLKFTKLYLQPCQLTGLIKPKKNTRLSNMLHLPLDTKNLIFSYIYPDFQEIPSQNHDGHHKKMFYMFQENLVNKFQKLQAKREKMQQKINSVKKIRKYNKQKNKSEVKLNLLNIKTLLKIY